MKRFAIAMAVASCATWATAAELPSYFDGVRPLGMGGAFTAVADDENALFYNPAGLDRVERWSMGLVNPLLEVGEKGMDLYKDSTDTDFDQEAEVIDLLQDYVGEYLHVRAALFPHVVMKHFALGVLGQATVNAEVHNPQYPEVQLSALATTGAHAGFGYGFWDGKLRLGVGGKYIKAKRLDQTYTAFDIAQPGFEDRIKDDDLKDGSGFGFDLGVMTTLPVLLEPTFALTILNVADTDLGDAGELPQQINLGVSASHSLGWVTLVGAADWVDVTQNLGSDDDPYRRLHFGLEGRLARILSLRAGLSQGYGAFGASVDFKLLKLEYATYAEEIGSAAGDRSDRRQVVQASLGW
jgi:hypothetical protein